MDDYAPHLGPHSMPPLIGAPIISDRVRMIEQAVNLVNTFRYSLVKGPTMDLGDAPTSDEGLTIQEESTYNAVLAFLSREFNRGPSEIAGMCLLSPEPLPEDDEDQAREPEPEAS